MWDFVLFWIKTLAFGTYIIVRQTMAPKTSQPRKKQVVGPQSSFVEDQFLNEEAQRRFETFFSNRIIILERQVELGRLSNTRLFSWIVQRHLKNLCIF